MLRKPWDPTQQRPRVCPKPNIHPSIEQPFRATGQDRGQFLTGNAGMAENLLPEQLRLN